jgi:hypothetical protein
MTMFSLKSYTKVSSNQLPICLIGAISRSGSTLAIFFFQIWSVWMPCAWACSFRWFIVIESTVRWFIVREKHYWMTTDSADKSNEQVHRDVSGHLNAVCRERRAFWSSLLWGREDIEDLKWKVCQTCLSRGVRTPSQRRLIIESSLLLDLARGGGRPSSLLASGFDLITSSQHGDSVRQLGFLALAVILFLSLLLPIRSRTVLFNFLHAAVTCDSSNTLKSKSKSCVA